MHADEMTYSVCAPNDESAISGGVLESYQKISNALLCALEIIGIMADSKKKKESDSGLLTIRFVFNFLRIMRSLFMKRN